MSEKFETVDDRLGDRAPTSHERASGLPWDASYHEGPAPWDVGRPQPAIVRLASEGRLVGPGLDAGCGTGENALHVASSGLVVLGVDVTRTALAIAREKARARGVEDEFAFADALQLDRLGRTFMTVLDCGLFHTFDADERGIYAARLASATDHHGTLYVLCFSDQVDCETDSGPVATGRLNGLLACRRRGALDTVGGGFNSWTRTLPMRTQPRLAWIRTPALRLVSAFATRYMPASNAEP